ncbi:replication restart DNA helicase PriA [Pedococcus dokdonensis]|uniref:Probable replication restart protein PriA n=1 Tax=Pedococcus dokdonensis TaxID=443156 RepID=A0A1H0PJS5_9MICO|nr:primosomal protein N' [Pedococcus dokdonensis]SDP04836.1 replication restart DNA helicase PriA [Pedococcus dokdonensis]
MSGHGADGGDEERGQATGEQLALIRASLPSPARSTRAAPSAAEATASTDPVASVVVDTGLAHLARPFDYLVPESLADTAVPGARVKVRFAGQDLDGFVVARQSEADHRGRLAPIRRVVSPEPVLTPTLLQVATEVAASCAGTLGDVLRLAVPPRHAAAEKALALQPPTPDPLPTPASPGPAWSRYAAGPAYLARLAAGDSPAASWLALPPTEPEGDWPAALAAAAAATLAGGRGSVLVVPDHRDVARVDAALTEALGPGRHVRLTADQGPQARYTAWLKVLRGHVSVVVGTRAAAFAPVCDLGLVAWWDDGDDLLDEPRAPYPHVRDVLLVRARVEGAAVLSGGFTRTVAVQQLVEAGALRTIAATTARGVVPRVQVAGEGAEVERDPAAASAHLPSIAWRTAKAALEQGPVLVQVPRRGYLPSLSCQTCRTAVRCSHCGGPVALSSRRAEPACRWCGRGVGRFECRQCGGRELRSSVVGARRTAEELGRAFPGVPVHTSGAGAVLERVAATAALVIATPGAEPVAEGGYAACLLLDAWASLDRPTLDAGEEALRRWTAAGGLTRGAAAGGQLVLCGAPTHTTLPVVEALVRWDPVWFAARELADRRDLSLPPTVALAAVTGERRAVEAALRLAQLPDGVERLGPLQVTDDTVRVLLRCPPDGREALAAALTALKAVRSARKEKASIQVRMDPRDPAT